MNLFVLSRSNNNDPVNIGESPHGSTNLASEHTEKFLGFYFAKITNIEKLSGKLIKASAEMMHLLGLTDPKPGTEINLLFDCICHEDKKKVEEAVNRVVHQDIAFSCHFRLIDYKGIPVVRVKALFSLTKVAEDGYPEIHCWLEKIGETNGYLLNTGNENIELDNIDKINQAIVTNQNLSEIGEIYLKAIGSNPSIKYSRLYIYDKDENKLSLVAETFENQLLSIIEKRIRIKVKSVIPPIKEGDFFHKLVKDQRTVITSDKTEIEEIVKAHINQHSLKKFVKWGINSLNLQTFGAIPLYVGEVTVGIVTFGADKQLSEQENNAILRYTRQVSGGIIQKITEKALKDQMELTTRILDELPLDITIFDRYHKFIYANKTAIKDDGLRKWVIGKSGVDYFIKKRRSSEAIDQLKQLFDELKNGKQQVQWVAKVVDKSGNKRQFLRSMHQINLSNSNYIVGFGIDVSQLMNTQEKLVEAQNIAKLGSWELDMQSGELILSDQAKQILGIEDKNEVFTLKRFYQLMQSPYRDEFIREISGDFISPMQNLEVKIETDNKSIVYVSFNALAVKDTSGLVRKITGTIMDITQLRKIEKRFTANQRLLMASEKIGKIGSWEVNFVDMKDWSKNTAFWSDESYRIFGYEPNSVTVSYPFFLEHVHPEDRHLVSINVTEWSVPGAHHESNFRIILKNGTVKHLHGRFNIEFDEKNVPVKMIGIVQDITSRKKLEQELHNYNQKLKNEIEKQTFELRNANNELDSFNYSISHDIRTPLRAIEMFSQLLKDNHKSDKQNLFYIRRIEYCVSEISQMIDSLLALSRFGKVAIVREQVNVRELIESSLESLKSQYPKAKIHISDTPHLYADAGLIRRVFDNLISNAAKYSSKTKIPVIEIRGIKSDDYTEYSIKDNGIGFDPNLSKELFKPFSRLHNDQDFEGNGAGLAIAERIISRHGGIIWASSKPAKGATFFFRIPNPKL